MSGVTLIVRFSASTEVTVTKVPPCFVSRIDHSTKSSSTSRTSLTWKPNVLSLPTVDTESWHSVAETEVIGPVRFARSDALSFDHTNVGTEPAVGSTKPLL